MAERREYVYILLNKAVLGPNSTILKIGRDNSDPRHRAHNLSSETGALYKFEFLMATAIRASQISQAESRIHQILRDYRLPGKEQFSVPVAEAVNALLKIEHEYGGERWHDIRNGAEPADPALGGQPKSEMDYEIQPSVPDRDANFEPAPRGVYRNRFRNDVDSAVKARDFPWKKPNKGDQRNIIYGTVARCRGAGVSIGAGIRTSKRDVYVYAYSTGNNGHIFEQAVKEQGLSTIVTRHGAEAFWSGSYFYVSTTIGYNDDENIPIEQIADIMVDLNKFLSSLK